MASSLTSAPWLSIGTRPAYNTLRSWDNEATKIEGLWDSVRLKDWHKTFGPTYALNLPPGSCILGAYSETFEIGVRNPNGAHRCQYGQIKFPA